MLAKMLHGQNQPPSKQINGLRNQGYQSVIQTEQTKPTNTSSADGDLNETKKRGISPTILPYSKSRPQRKPTPHPSLFEVKTSATSCNTSKNGSKTRGYLHLPRTRYQGNTPNQRRIMQSPKRNSATLSCASFNAGNPIVIAVLYFNGIVDV